MSEFAALVERLLTAASLAQAVAVAAAVAIAWAGHRVAQRWYVARSEEGIRPVGLVLEALVVAAPYIAAVAILAAARAAAAAPDAAALADALQVAVALIVIRLAIFALRRAVSPTARFKHLENRVALAIWVVVSAQMLGWFDTVVRALDSIGLAAGAERITVWSVLAALFTVSVCVVAGVWAARWLDRKMATVEALAPSTRVGLTKAAYAFFIGFGILLGLRASGVDLTALAVFSGAIGLGLGFGLQAIAANFVSGFVLLVDKSIKPGDVISFTGTTGTSTTGFGWVEALRGRYVVVRDRDGVATLVPNQNLITNQVINWSYGHPKVRLRLPVRISYRDDAELALRLLLEAAGAHPRILADPPPVSRLMEFAEYGMEVELRFWIGDPAEGVNNVRSDVNRRIWALFRQHGITIPPAQREIRILEGGVSASVLAPPQRGPIEPSQDGQD